MVSPKTLSKLASARNTAERAGMNDTSERLELLRRELAGFSGLPIQQKPAKASWAIAKVDETRTCMARETEGQAAALKDRQTGHDIAAIVTKIILSAGSMFSCMKAILANPGHPFLIGAVFLAGLLAGAGIIDRTIGSRDEKEAADDIGRILDDVRKSLTCQLWKRV